MKLFVCWLIAWHLFTFWLIKRSTDEANDDRGWIVPSVLFAVVAVGADVALPVYLLVRWLVA